MNSNIDFLIVGSGIYGATIARVLTDIGYSCLIVEKNDHIGGMCFDFMHNGYYLHTQGPHIFHTDKYVVQKFFTTYCRLNRYSHSVVAQSGDNTYMLPVNLHTLKDLFGTTEQDKIYDKINEEIELAKNEYGDRTDLEATANIMFGSTIYLNLIKSYTEKQWNKECKDLPGEIIKRFKINYDYDSRYFGDELCGVPTDGFTNTIGRIIDGESNEKNPRKSIPCLLNIDVSKNPEYWLNLPNYNTIYCGAIDELLGYELGELEWRSLKFENKEYEFDGYNGQGIAVINHLDKEKEYTRTTEHMYFYKESIKHENLPIASVVTYEYSQDFDKEKNERYYPINNEKNTELYNKYLKLLVERYPKCLMGGRIGKYKYFDIDDAIYEAIVDANNINNFYKNTNSGDEGSTV